MALNWTTLENAIRAWVRDSSGLDGARVYWAEQDVNQPATGAFITIRIGDLLAKGATDEVVQTYDSEADPDSDLVTTVYGRREFPVSIQCFGGPSVGSGTPREILSTVQTALGLPSTQDDFARAGLSCFDRGSVRNVAALREDAFEARAVLEVRFYVTEDASETGTWIETVQVEDDTITD